VIEIINVLINEFELSLSNAIPIAANVRNAVLLVADSKIELFLTRSLTLTIIFDLYSLTLTLMWYMPRVPSDN